MLTTLQLSNLALAKDLRLEFGPGLNIISGETGAGKSILMGALSLLLGERADKSLIRSGENLCSVEAVFELAYPASVDRLLEERGIALCEEQQLVVRRTVRQVGASQRFVNDCPVTLAVLKELGRLLVDMHGPYDHQSLLYPSAQLEILDAFGHLNNERLAYTDLYAHARSVEAKCKEFSENQDLDDQIELLRHRVQEIEEAQLDEADEQKVKEEHHVLSHAQSILEVSGQIAHALTEGTGSAFDQLADAYRLMENLSHDLPEASPWVSDLREINQGVQDLSANLRSRIEGLEADPSRLEWLEARMSIYAKLKAKYGPKLGEVLDERDKASERLRALEAQQAERPQLQAKLQEIRRKLRQTGERLHKKRVQHAKLLANAVTKELRMLGFHQGVLEVRVDRVEPGPYGADHVEFAFAPNVGEAMRPLRSIASSGEISRVMLAIKAVVAEHDRIPVLVFDEVDANVGGEMGQAIGQKLSQISEKHQIVAITHLPQVAIFGQVHFAVSKRVEDRRTFTEVRCLQNNEARVEELARMLGGKKRTKLTREHAREMLQAVCS